jgi:tetratricopeptide (TPR) repeat protein
MNLQATMLGALLLACAPPARAMTAAQERVVEDGLNALYRSDFEGAEKIFFESRAEHPGDPVYSLGCAVSAWWRLENDFVPPGGREEKEFYAALDRALADAKHEADEGSKAEGSLYLGAAYSLRGRREAAQHKWLAAYLDGRRAYRNESKAVKLDPNLADAYLGLGAFDYYVATLSRFVRLFTFASGGDKTKGLDELKRAAEGGRFGSVAAKLVLVGIDWTFEKKPKDALVILEELHRRYPESPLMDAMMLIGLFHLRDGEELTKQARVFLAKAERRAPFFRPIDLPAGRYFLGLGEQLSGRYPQAIAQYEAAFTEVPPQHPWRSMLRLFIGECLDLTGRRDEAVASYRQALAEPPLWGVPRYAKYLLKHPFQPGDNPLPARNDDLQ